MENLKTECAVIVDTNILMEVPEIYDLNWGVDPTTVYVLRPVLDELYGLARDRQNRAKARAAQSAHDKLIHISRQMPPEGHPLPGGGRLLFPAAPSQIQAPLDPESVDHQQIALAREHLKATPSRFCAIVTRDREMQDIAISTRPTVPVVMPGEGGDVHSETQRDKAREIAHSDTAQPSTQSS